MGGVMEVPGYNIVDTLGEGRAATVYLAFVENSDQEVALKVFSKAVSDDKAFGVQFDRQASRLSVLKHPNIANVYEQGRHAGRYYLAMEYIPGRTLRHRRFELELAEQLHVLQTVAEAVGLAHELGCVHGNLTLDSIMLRDDSMEPALLDFGVGWPIGAAVIGNDLTAEQGRGTTVDERSDLYSLGQILLLLLYDLLPHPPTPPGKVPQLRTELEIFQPLLECTLGPDAAQRYASCTEFAEALAALPPEQIEAVVKNCEEVLIREGELTKLAEKTEPNTAVPVKPEEAPEPAGDELALDLREPDEGAPIEDLVADEGLVEKEDLVEQEDLGAKEGLVANSDDRIEPKATRQFEWTAVLPWALAGLVVMGALLMMLQPV